MPDLMLATRGSPLDFTWLQERGYIFDMKVDGVRCLATITKGEVCLTSRTGIDITKCYPEVVQALKDTRLSDVEFDGELSIFDERGLPSWPLTHLRAAKQAKYEHWAAAMPAHYMVFDILSLNGQDMRGWAYANRRHVLTEEVKGSELIVPTVSTPNGDALWDVVVQHELEGVIAKRPDAPYRPGRSRDWIKIKRTNTVSCLVGGFDPGEGSRASTFGCLHLYLIDAAGGLMPVGKVGSGFSDRELRQVARMMRGTQPLIVEVEYLDVSPDGVLRQPVFQRVREDLHVTDCTYDQLLKGVGA